MRLDVIFCLWLMSFGDHSLDVTLRGKAQTLDHLAPAKNTGNVAVIFLPGDWGWHGTAVSMGRAVSSWGYDVYGFDTRHYLEGPGLSRDQLADDVRKLAEQVSAASHKPVVLVGWSQGAGMAVAAASNNPARQVIKGVVTLGLPESAVLGWDWKATAAVVAHREPDQPKFTVKPLLADIGPTPVWMIHGSLDEYTTPAAGRDLFRAASEPKQLQEIAGANHRFDGHQDELYRSMREGLAWIAGRQASLSK